MFESISIAPIDPIIDLLKLFLADSRPEKINLGIGVYKDETGSIPVLTSVKKAEALLLKHEISKNYLGIEGLTIFTISTQRLLFGSNATLISNERIRSAQTPGGTSALRVAADFLSNNTTARRIWLSNPSWPNHKNIFRAAGLEVCYYSYYNHVTHTLDFTAMLSSLKKVQAGDIVLFHGCCHNPTGADPSPQQWRELASISFNNGWLPLFDFSYQGLAHNLEQDALGLRIFCESHQEIIVCSSYSKNFGLYNERVGACTLIAPSREIADRAFSQLKFIIRANYSSPPIHGAAIVAIILTNKILRSIWEQELNGMRDRIKRMRELFVNTLLDKGAKYDFSFIKNQNGMFSFIGLNQKQVIKLRDKSGIYMLNSGRINIASITLDNLPKICEAIINVL